MHRISILGCGWLGFPLAKNLIAAGYSVNGSTTSEGKIKDLKIAGISPYLINLKSDSFTGDVSAFLGHSDILIIDIPPKIRTGESFVRKIEVLLQFIIASKIKKVLFISSTSVFSDKNAEVTSETIPDPDTESGKQLLQTEKLLQSQQLFQCTVLRFGGLIADDRHPVYSLSGKINIENSDKPVNLIHRDDCIRIIQLLIDRDIWGESFNAAAPFHPTRHDYYTAKAIELGLPIPSFNHTKKAAGKNISTDSLCNILQFQFKYPEL